MKWMNAAIVYVILMHCCLTAVLSQSDSTSTDETTEHSTSAAHETSESTSHLESTEHHSGSTEHHSGSTEHHSGSTEHHSGSTEADWTGSTMSVPPGGSGSIIQLHSSLVAFMITLVAKCLFFH